MSHLSAVTRLKYTYICENITKKIIARKIYLYFGKYIYFDKYN